jgi:hypothetical protein
LGFLGTINPIATIRIFLMTHRLKNRNCIPTGPPATQRARPSRNDPVGGQLDSMHVNRHDKINHNTFPAGLTFKSSNPCSLWMWEGEG